MSLKKPPTRSVRFDRTPIDFDPF